jgi:ABC-type multidrug transport system fused ATPase/permease subunit
MKTFLAFLLAFIFFFTFPIFVFSFSFNYILTPSYIKATLGKSGVYQASTNALIFSIDQMKDETGASIEDKQELKNFVQAQITPNYLKKTVESFIDDTSAYLNNKRKDPPGIKLSDLKPKAQEIFGNEPLPKEMDAFLSKPHTIPEKQASGFRNTFQLSQKVTIPLAIANLVLLGLIFLSAKGLKSKLRWVSLTLFIPTIVGLIGVAVMIVLGQLITYMVTNRLSESQVKQFEEPIRNLIQLLVADLAGRMLLLYAIAFVVAAIILAISFFIKSKTALVGAVSTPQQSSHQTPPQLSSQPQNAI